MQVIYSSGTGNTAKLAACVAEALGCEAIAVANAQELSDCVVLGFWCDKGQIDEAATEVLKRLRGKQVALFYTAGVEREHDYVAQMNEQFAATARELGASVIAEVFMSQGAISQEIIAMQKQLNAQEPEKYPITPEKIARWEASQAHPDEADFARAREWAAGLADASKQLARAINHMRDDHMQNVADVAAAQGMAGDAELVALDYRGMGIAAGGDYRWVAYETVPATPKDLHMSVVELCVNVKKSPEPSGLEAEMLAFRRGFKSAVIASITPAGHALASYAPIIEHEGALYAFVSEVADHYAALASNPDASVMFVQDESAAAMVFARVRLRYEVRAEVLPRAGDGAGGAGGTGASGAGGAGGADGGAGGASVSAEFEEALFAQLAATSGGSVGMFAAMKDFHFVRLHIKGGRFVKGFGAAFDIDAAGKPHAVRVNSPHRKR